MTLLQFLVLFLPAIAGVRLLLIGVPAFATILFLLTALHLLLLLAAPTNTVVPTVAVVLVLNTNQNRLSDNDCGTAN